MSTVRIAVVPGDGIGREVVPAGLAVLEPAARRAGVSLNLVEFPWSCAYYRQTGRMMDPDALDRMAGFDALYLGAIGDPSVPDHVSVWEMILPVRQRFEQYVNLRPMRWLPGVRGPLAGRAPQDVDMVCVRENTEGEYAGIGRRLHVGTPEEMAEQTGLDGFVTPDLGGTANTASSRAERSSASSATPSRSPRVADGRCWPAPPSPTRFSTRWSSGMRSSRRSMASTRR